MKELEELRKSVTPEEVAETKKIMEKQRKKIKSSTKKKEDTTEKSS